MATTDTSKPDTIVLIHGLFMTPRSWEHWIEHFKQRGFKVLAPACRGGGVGGEPPRRDPPQREKLTIDETAHHEETTGGGRGRPPILMGHSFGGAMVQILLDRGVGAAGVTIDSAPVKGVLR